MNPQRQQDVTRRVVIDLKAVEERIPRNGSGDPAFTSLHPHDHQDEPEFCVLDVFTVDQVVALVNRALYQMEYSRTSHRNRSQKLRDQEKPVREAFKRLYPTVSWANATEEQIKAAVQAVYQPKGDQP
jgi:hypothetical protein